MQLPTEHGHESLLQSCESDPKGSFSYWQRWYLAVV